MNGGGASHVYHYIHKTSHVFFTLYVILYILIVIVAAAKPILINYISQNTLYITKLYIFAKKRYRSTRRKDKT